MRLETVKIVFLEHHATAMVTAIIDNKSESSEKKF
jgi:hypothetical protein